MYIWQEISSRCILLIYNELKTIVFETILPLPINLSQVPNTKKCLFLQLQLNLFIGIRKIVVVLRDDKKYLFVVLEIILWTTFIRSKNSGCIWATHISKLDKNRAFVCITFFFFLIKDGIVYWNSLCKLKYSSTKFLLWSEG